MINNDVLTTLEYDKVLLQLAHFTVTDRGRAAVLSIVPPSCYDDSLVLINETNEADKLLYKHTITPDLYYDDIGNSLIKSEKSIILTMGELLAIARLLRVSRLNKEIIQNVNDAEIILLKDYSFMLYCDNTLENDITKSIISDNEMSDNASHELKEIRAAILKCNEKIRVKLNQYVTSSAYTKYLQDSLITIRNNRYVLPVKSESYAQIPGLVHDRSASMATMFIEPFAIVDLNNELANLKISEAHEIEVILSRFTNRVGGSSGEIAENIQILSQLDMIFAKAQYAHANNAEKPNLTRDGAITIIHGRHPLLARDKVVPISITIDKNSRIFLVSGSNTGGKTVTMKLVGLSSLMAMSGIFPLSEFGSSYRYFDNVFCDIGDHQSIEMSLSTFSSHLANLVHITENITPNSLVLLDELGAGTDPQEGVALALAITKFIDRSGACAIITTHFRQMKELANRYSNIECGSMDFDPISYAPTYKLVVGVAGSSNALKIAKMLGLRDDILSAAESELPDEKIQLDSAIESFELKRREYEERLSAIKELELDAKRLHNQADIDRKFILQTREKLGEKMKYEANKLLKEYLEDAEDIIAEIKDTLNEPTEEGLFKARALKSQLAKLEYEEDDNEEILHFTESQDISVGDNVYIDSLKNIATVIKIDERKRLISVKINNLVTEAKYNQCKKVTNNPAPRKEKSTHSTIKREFSSVAVPLEIKLMGMDVDTACLELDKYIDAAVGNRYVEVRVVHGKGTGALRKGVQSFLRCDKRVASYRLGNYGEGDSGVTVVRLKE